MNRAGFLGALLGLGFTSVIPREEATKFHRQRLDGAWLSNKRILRELEKQQHLQNFQQYVEEYNQLIHKYRHLWR